jgi:hypothetical protein
VDAARKQQFAQINAARPASSPGQRPTMSRSSASSSSSHSSKPTSASASGCSTTPTPTSPAALAMEPPPTSSRSSCRRSPQPATPVRGYLTPRSLSTHTRTWNETTKAATSTDCDEPESQPSRVVAGLRPSAGPPLRQGSRRTTAAGSIGKRSIRKRRRTGPYGGQARDECGQQEHARDHRPCTGGHRQCRGGRRQRREEDHSSACGAVLPRHTRLTVANRFDKVGIVSSQRILDRIEPSVVLIVEHGRSPCMPDCVVAIESRWPPTGRR